MANALMEQMFEELAGSNTFEFERGKGSCVRIGKIAWSNIPAFLELALPSARLLGRSIYIPPVPSHPTFKWLLVKSVSFSPLFDENIENDTLNPIKYEYAQATVKYTTPEYDQSSPGNDTPGTQPTTFITMKVSVGGEFLVWPSAGLSWSLPQDPSLYGSHSGLAQRQTVVNPEVQVGVVLPIIEHHITWNYVAFPPWLMIRRCIGKVNAYSFVGAPPETLLFLGVEASRETTSQGTRMWQLEYKFGEKNNNALNPLQPYGWNYFLRPDGQYAGTFQRMNRRSPGSATILGASINDVALTLTVKNGSGFPFLGSFNVRIDNEEMTISSTNGSSNEWTISARGVNGTAAAAHTQGALITQGFKTTLQGNITAKTTTIVVVSRASFPSNGSQFFVKIDDEKMAVTAVGDVTIGGTAYGIFKVLRAVTGTLAAAHSAGATVELVPNGVYDLADFRLLFLSGLVTG